ncbi:putative E3 ubiquitin-protein ligase [Nymphaea thermarum]|nr:putative E3 ubiquitin-protein ligase [Nymphaea thermarum]
MDDSDADCFDFVDELGDLVADRLDLSDANCFDFVDELGDLVADSLDLSDANCFDFVDELGDLVADRLDLDADYFDFVDELGDLVADRLDLDTDRLDLDTDRLDFVSDLPADRLDFVLDLVADSVDFVGDLVADRLDFVDDLHADRLDFVDDLVATPPPHPATSRRDLPPPSPTSTSRPEGEASGFVCGICMEPKEISETFRNPSCSHRFCIDCTRQHLTVRIQENANRVRCPESGCKVTMDPESCQGIVPGQLFERWSAVLSESAISAENRVYCPYGDCSAPMEVEGGSVIVQAECPHCNRLFCAKCKTPWHAGFDCEEHQLGDTGTNDILLKKLAKEKMWSRCPACRFYVERVDGCPHITCRCSFQFCYLCGGDWDQAYHACTLEAAGEDLLPVSDGKYADALQFQEVVMASVISSIRKMPSPHPATSRRDLPPPSPTSTSRLEGEPSGFVCGICMEPKAISETFQNRSCSHRFCIDCTRQHLTVRIQENASRVRCPESGCKAEIDPEWCQGIVPDQVFERWSAVLSESAISAENRVYCPYGDCSAPMEVEGRSVILQAECPHCNRLFCAKCKTPWHAHFDCEEYSRLGDSGMNDILLKKLAKEKLWARCPACKFYVEKVEGCSHITCRYVHNAHRTALEFIFPKYHFAPSSHSECAAFNSATSVVVLGARRIMLVVDDAYILVAFTCD